MKIDTNMRVENKGIVGEQIRLLSGKLNDVPSGRLFYADFGFMQRCPSL